MLNAIISGCYHNLAAALRYRTRAMRAYYHIRRWRSRLLREHRARTRQ